MKRHSKIVFRVLLSTRMLYLIPVIILFGFLPMMTCRYIVIFDSAQEAFVPISRLMRLSIPIISIWWPFQFLREYAEGDGRELFRVLQDGGKELYQEILLVFVWYVLHVAVLAAGQSLVLPSMAYLFGRVFALTLLFFGFYVCMVFVLHNTGMAMLTVLIYYFIAAFFSDGTRLEYVSVFLLGDMVGYRMYLLFGILGVLLLVVGYRQLTNGKKNFFV